MTFGILTINHRRPQVLNLFLASMRRLRKEVNIDFPVVCVSGVEDRKMCAQYGVHHIVQANRPASMKWDTGMSFLQKLNLDYVLVLGSDDIMSTDLLRAYMIEMKNDVDLIGVNEIFVYDGDGKTRGALRRYTSGKVLGVGKMLNKRILDKVLWRPWASSQPRSFGMDSLLGRSTNKHIRTSSVVSGVLVDVKSKDSLNKFTMFVVNQKGTPAKVEIFYDILGEEEKEILKSL